MMKTTIKFMSMVLAIVMMMGAIATPSSAIAFNSSKNKEMIIEELKKLDFTDKEIIELFEKDERREKFQTFAFPKDPEIGQWHTEKYKLSNVILGLPAGGIGVIAISQKQLAKNIVAYVGASSVLWATMAAGLIIAAANEHSGYNGFNIIVDFIYGPDNHQDISWTPGEVSVVRYK